MTQPFEPPPIDVVHEIRRLSGRSLSAAEFAAYVNAPMSEPERAQALELMDWFVRRYPTPAERLAYARRAFRRAAARSPHAPRLSE
jgi:hypothetical protein